MPKDPVCDERYYVVRKEFFIISHDGSQAFNKIVIGFSSAILTFVLGFVLYGEPSVHGGLLLGMAGAFLIVAIIFSLYSLWVCQDYAAHGVNHLNKQYENHGEIREPFDHKSIKQMINAQKFAGYFFVFGLVFALVFILRNVISWHDVEAIFYWLSNLVQRESLSGLVHLQGYFYYPF